MQVLTPQEGGGWEGIPKHRKKYVQKDVTDSSVLRECRSANESLVHSEALQTLQKSKEVSDALGWGPSSSPISQVSLSSYPELTSVW